VTTPFREGRAVPEDAIRSIRVASTLIERFRALIATEPSSIAELELRIGESQQIYPEIWSHLDDARDVLAQQGRVVAPFDELRGREAGHLGVTNIEIERKLGVGATLVGARITYSASKTASFNVGGLARAIDAAHALMATLPEVDWTGLARAEDREIAAAGSMQTRKWINIVKVVGAAAAVVVVAIVSHRLVTSVHEEPQAAEPKQVDLVGSTRYTLAKLRGERITRMRDVYAMTCDRTLVPELVQLLRDDGQTSTAKHIEDSACTRETASCEKVSVPVEDRLVQRYGLGRNRVLDFACRGIVIGEPGALQRAFVVSISGRGPDKQIHAYRGVVATDGENDIVPFAEAPVPAFVGTGDLDGDHRDEVVMVGGSRLVVSRIAGNRFIDIDGPALRAGCQGSVNVERDLREEGKPVHDSLVIAVDDPHPRGGCPETGRHFYVLAGDTLRADE
jgi:hypothetical protein